MGRVLLLLSWILRLLVQLHGWTGDLRPQLKWLMVGGALCVVGILSGALLSGIGAALFTLIMASPIQIGIAILKYRLLRHEGSRSAARCPYLVDPARTVHRCLRGLGGL